MQYHKLGRSDLNVSTVAVGFWAVADPRMWGDQDPQHALDAVQTALDLGINFFDTAEGYGDGDSEALLGKALGARRSEAIVATKVSRSNLAPDALIAACERSLRLLNTDYIDLYQVHWPNWDIPFEETFSALEKLRDQGKIRVIGVSNFGRRDLPDALAVARFESNQLPYNLLFRAIEYEIAPICEAHEISILAYSPLLQGLLTGKFASLDDLPAQRQRTRHFRPDRPMARHGEPGAEAETAQAVAAIRAISDAAGIPMAQLALAWLLHQPGMAAVIAGARSPAQARENAQAAGIALDADLLAALDQATAAIKARLGANPDMWQSGDNGRFR